MDVTRINIGPGRYTEATQLFAGVCNPRYTLTGTVIAAEGGLFVGEDGNDIAACCVMGRWHDIRHIGAASGWTDLHNRPVPADMMARITTASEPQPARTA